MPRSQYEEDIYNLLQHMVNLVHALSAISDPATRRTRGTSPHQSYPKQQIVRCIIIRFLCNPASPQDKSLQQSILNRPMRNDSRSLKEMFETEKEKKKNH